MKTILILLFAAGLLPRTISAQTMYPEKPENAGFTGRSSSVYGWLLNSSVRTPKAPEGFPRVRIPPALPLAPLAGIPQDYYTLHWGVMCRFEWQTYRHLKVPLSIRLGTLEYENRLEGKPR